MRGNDALIGGAGDDILQGGPGGDRLWGQIGKDRLNGGANDDRLYGGAGDDRLVGGAGRDLFVCGGAFGSDTVLDFHDGLDRFDLESDLGFSDLALRRLDCDGDGVRDDVRIDVAGRGVIQVLDEALGAFGAADFLF